MVIYLLVSHLPRAPILLECAVEVVAQSLVERSLDERRLGDLREE